MKIEYVPPTKKTTLLTVTLQLLFTIVLCELGNNSRVETWNLRCFETSDLDFETRVSDPPGGEQYHIIISSL